MSLDSSHFICTATWTSTFSNIIVSLRTQHRQRLKVPLTFNTFFLLTDVPVLISIFHPAVKIQPQEVLISHTHHCLHTKVGFQSCGYHHSPLDSHNQHNLLLNVSDSLTPLTVWAYHLSACNRHIFYQIQPQVVRITQWISHHRLST